MELKEMDEPKNHVFINIADMLQYSENMYVIDCPSCGMEHWFELPDNNDKCKCDCGIVIVVCN